MSQSLRKKDSSKENYVLKYSKAGVSNSRGPIKKKKLSAPNGKKINGPQKRVKCT
jgi:hypothetical protein